MHLGIRRAGMRKEEKQLAAASGAPVDKKAK